MKIRNYLTILLAMLAIAALLALAGFMTLYSADKDNPLRQQIMQLLHLEDSTAAKNTPDANADGEDATPQTAASVKEHTLLFAGDSRTVGMGNAVNDSCIYIGESGEGYQWLTENGLSQISSALESDPAIPVILNFGVNDPENISLYIDCYRSLMDTYTDTPIYILSVNPLENDADFNTTNEMVELFNATMQNAFPDNYLDCYSYLTGSGFETVDGLHYTEETYQAIHDYAVEQVA